MKAIERRTFLKAAALITGGVVGYPGYPALGSTLTGLSGTTGASRTSRLDPSGSLVAVHTDLHNHSFISGDAEGDPYRALDNIRAKGIDVACMTEHAVSGKDHGQYDCAKWQDGGCRFIEGINQNDWATMAKIADDAYDPGSFVSFRGFEYSTPTVGHINVWFGQDFTDPLHEGALVTPAEFSQMYRVFDNPVTEAVSGAFDGAPDTAQITPFYDWLTSAPGSLPFGGGSDAIASFNHPGYFGNFQSFLFHSGAAKQIFLIEGFNAITYDGGPTNNATDYFWYGRDAGLPQPFNACFNAGWTVGFTGVSDEHSGTYGQTGKGRGGLYLSEVTREGVRQAIMTRRSFGTRETGLRLDATANGYPMGSVMPPTSGPLTVELDIDRGPDWVGKQLYVQVIGPGPNDPSLLEVVPVTVPAPTQPVLSFSVTPKGSWLFLRICDPDRALDPLGVEPFESPTYGGASAYVSPWFFRSA